MTAELVVEEDDPHFGLPDIWDGQQVVCIHFPEAEAPEDFDRGRTHIDYDGTEFMSDAEFPTEHHAILVRSDGRLDSGS